MAAKKKATSKKTGSKKTGSKKTGSKKTGSKKTGSKKTSTRKYSRGASKKVGRAMHEMKRGELRSGRSKKKVKNRKQAIAIGLSEARRAGKKVPPRRSAR